MLYKCEHCNYTSNRLSNLVRHKNRLYPCNKTLKVNVCKREEVNINEQINNVDEHNNNANQQNNNADQQNNNANQQNNNADQQNNNAHEQNNNVSNNIKFQCSKCKKELSSNQRLKRHEEKCDGLDPKQCKICLKIFTTQQGKFQHISYVKCSPPRSPSSSNITNNITNNIDNSNNSVNTNNNIQINIRADFDKITNDYIQNIVSQITQTDYLQMVSENIDIGKYVIPRTMEQIYFNDQFPEMQTLKKERRNDKLMGVHVGNGKWEKRLVDDIYNKIIGRVEDFHTKYFQYIEEKYKDVKVGSPRWKQLMRPIKTFGNTMLWYEGFSGDIIENMGIQLNYPDEDDEEIEKLREKRNKEMEQLISEKVYEETLVKEKACI